jgi:alkylresorcinol/alkylpyrone synthase
MARVLATGTALPAHRYGQAEVKRAYASMFAGQGLERYLSIFDRSGVASRCFVKPLDYYREARPFSERNREYLGAALELSTEAARRCLDAAEAKPEEVGQVVWVTTTGLATPSLDTAIVQRLGLDARVRRTPVFGTGCASGAVALARAAELSAGRPGEKVLALSAELCSLTLQRRDLSVENLVACALFADGAAAVLLGGGGAGPRIAASRIPRA